MSVIKSTRKDGGYRTSVQPDTDTNTTIKELKELGDTNIYDAETGEKYN